MSVFRGSIVEYPGVIVDHFATRNTITGRAFFLSHCHRDHMSGLDSPELFTALKERNEKLFCSEVTKALLLKDPEFIKLADYLEALPMEEPVSMTLDQQQDQKALSLTVTLLPAGHCPGSAMFLFQGENGNALYTGDFRLTIEELKRISPLHVNGSVLKLRTLYLDTTFCHPNSTNISSRDSARETILSITKRWLGKSQRNVVRLHCPTYGYEHILMAVAKQHNTRIHIARWRMNAYSALPLVADCLTGDGANTRIHCCNFRKKQKKTVGLPCGALVENGQPPHVLTIKPSTQWFVSRSSSCSLSGSSDSVVYIKQFNMYRVMHSMHASYSELCSFVRYLQPSTILPCVIPATMGDTALTDLHSRLKGLLSAPSEATPSSLHVSVVPSTVTKTSLLQRKDHEGEEGETDDELISSGEVAEPTHNPSCKPDSVNLPSMLLKKEIHQDSLSPPLSQVRTSPASLELHQPILELSFSDSSNSSAAEVKIENDWFQNESHFSLDDLSKSQRRRTLSPDSCDGTRDMLHEPKRMKMDDWSTELNETLTERSLDEKSSPLGNGDIEQKSPGDPPEIIDLTNEEDSSSSEASDVTTEHLTPAKSGSGSPVLIIPLTPGKEDSQSILQRKSIAFMGF